MGMCKTCRQFGAIPALICQLRNEDTKVVVPVLGALRNLSFGRINDENKLNIVREQGLEELTMALKMFRISEVPFVQSCIYTMYMYMYMH